MSRAEPEAVAGAFEPPNATPPALNAFLAEKVAIKMAGRDNLAARMMRKRVCRSWRV